MKTIFFALVISIALFGFESCSTSSTTKPPTGFAPDGVYDGLQIGTLKQDVIAKLGKNYKFDMNNVSQTPDYYVETLIWSSADPNVAYVLTFTNNKLSRKTREPVVKENGKNVQLPR